MNKEVVKYLGGRFIPALVSLIVILLAVRFIGAVEYARYSLVISAVLLAVTLNYHWVQVSMLRFLGSSPRESKVVTGRFFDITAITALFSTIVISLAGHFYFELERIELILIALFTFFTHFYLFHQAFLQVHNRMIRSALIEGIDQLVVMGGILAGLFLFDITTALLLFGSMALGRAGALVFRYLIRSPELAVVDLKHFYWDSRFSGKVVEFGMNVALWLFFSQLLSSVDRFIIYEYSGYQDTGVYSALKDLIYKGVTFSIFPIYASYKPRIIDQWNSRHKREAWSMIKEAISFEILIFIVVFIVFMVARTALFNDVMRLPELEDWTIYLPILISAFLWQIVLLFQRFLDLALRSMFVLKTMGITVVINISLNFILLPLMGLAGSALSLLIATVFYVAMVFTRCVFVERKECGDSV